MTMEYIQRGENDFGIFFSYSRYLRDEKIKSTEEEKKGEYEF